MKEDFKEEIRSVISKMTLDDKIAMIHGAHLFQNGSVERLSIPALTMSDGPMGVRAEFEPDHWMPMQHSSDQVTYLPCNSALASTWNRSLSKDMGSVLGEENRGRGKDISLAPGINIKRTPLCGRNFEYFSEDPYITGELASEFVKGLQEWDVAACVKHFALNNQETQRLEVNAEVDEEVLRRIYLRAFHKVLKEGGAYSVMGAYNKYKDDYCNENPFLLTQILRDEWKWDGTVISDWGGVHNTDKAAVSDLDLEMSVKDNFDEYVMANPLKQKIESGEIDEAYIDKKVYHLLLLMYRLKMLGGFVRKCGSYNTPMHRQVALDVARESVILLKNDNNILPLKRDKLKKVLVIGENGDRIHSNAGGSAEIKALYEITPLMGLRSHIGGNCKVDYAEGYTSRFKADEPSAFDEGGTNWERLDAIRKAAEANWQEASLENGGGKTQSVINVDEKLSALRKKLRDEALSMASDTSYEKVIFIGGINHDFDSEGIDRINMELPYEQNELIEELLKIRPDLVVVMVAGSPVNMTPWADKVKALIWTYYNGIEGGNALADVILGNVNPSGKLAETIGHDLKDYGSHVLAKFPEPETAHYTEGFKVGYRFNDTDKVEPLFPFGYGLSYTSFEYRSPKMSLDSNGNKVITVCIQNTGKVSGSEIVQVYARRKGAEVFQELAGFEKVYIRAGEEREVEIQIELDHETELSKSFNKSVEYAIGSSSRDIRMVI
ncbi:MAG: glycoside hydrolase family 3 C-terminal domain-containing protein [Butyrivibrio sp.]|uniref:beta-glucosidase n=1 Tax=Butyrivibrio sp. TaxID=28121 RepID=UPI0025CE6FF6|nr:glycoside hydrolase family 3 C-terminal domain-containing protein [Butyrivibrio sp.]MCR5771897.1 glycoside hydrolase family 3 C-terminal domain-containing protein [Butyrivibrio sp.]